MGQAWDRGSAEGTELLVLVPWGEEARGLRKKDVLLPRLLLLAMPARLQGWLVRRGTITAAT